MNIDNIFGKRMTKRERREAKRREADRMAERAEIARARSIYTTRDSKKLQMKKMEKLPSFKRDLKMMKVIYKKGKPLRDPEFFKSKTDFELKGSEKQFKKKDGFLRL